MERQLKRAPNPVTQRRVSLERRMRRAFVNCTSGAKAQEFVERCLAIAMSDDHEQDPDRAQYAKLILDRLFPVKDFRKIEARNSQPHVNILHVSETKMKAMGEIAREVHLSGARGR